MKQMPGSYYGAFDPWRLKYWLSIVSALTLDHQQWNFPVDIWCVALVSTLVAVAGLSKWKSDQTGYI